MISVPLMLGLVFVLSYIMLLIFRFLCSYRCMRNRLSNLPVYKGLTFFNFPKWAIYLTKFGDIPPNVYLLQLLAGGRKLFSEGIALGWIFFTPFVMVFKADIFQALITHSAVQEKAPQYDLGNAVFGNGLVCSRGEIWRFHRKAIIPAFHLGNLKRYLPIYNHHSNVLVKKLKDLSKEPWIEITPILKSCSFDIIMESAIGLDMRCQEGDAEGLSFMKIMNELADIFAYRVPRPWTHYDFIFFCMPKGRKLRKCSEDLRHLTEKIIEKRKAAYLYEKRVVTDIKMDEESVSEKNVFIESLLEAHFSDGLFSLSDIEHEVKTFIVAGYETLSAALAFTLYLVGLDLNVQNNIFQELDYIFQSDPHRPVTHEDLSNMKYLECVIKESLRLYPPFPFMGRQSQKEVQIGKFTVHPGCILFFNIYLLHRDPEVFPNPEKFDPDRFLPENCLNRNPFAFMPFSAGSRNCIGQKFAMMETKVVLCHIFRNFTVQSIDPRDKVMVSWELLLRTVEPIRIRFTPRHE